MVHTTKQIEGVHVVTIPGEPVAYQRTRTRANGVRFKPTKHRHWESGAVAAMTLQTTGPALSGPVGVNICAVYPRPKSRPKSVSLAAWASPGLVPIPSARADLDNVVKLVLDAAVKAGLVVDDRHVQTIQAGHYYAEQGGEPRVRLILWRVDGDSVASDGAGDVS